MVGRDIKPSKEKKRLDVKVTLFSGFITAKLIINLGSTLNGVRKYNT